MVIPIVKKGEGKMVEEYKGITLMPMLYKVYILVLVKRLKSKTEELGLILHNQMRFKKSMGTVDNIFALSYMINK